MSSPRIRAVEAGFAVLILMGACTSGGSESTYFVHPTNGWKLKEAINPENEGSPGQPSLDWYAEYERFPTPVRSELVVLSGHDGAQLREELTAFKLRSARVRGAAGQAGTSPDGQPSVVFFEPTQGYAVMVLSNELSVTALMRWMAQLEPASEERWIDAGGRINE